MVSNSRLSVFRLCIALIAISISNLALAEQCSTIDEKTLGFQDWTLTGNPNECSTVNSTGINLKSCAASSTDGGNSSAEDVIELHATKVYPTLCATTHPYLAFELDPEQTGFFEASIELSNGQKRQTISLLRTARAQRIVPGSNGDTSLHIIDLQKILNGQVYDSLTLTLSAKGNVAPKVFVRNVVQMTEPSSDTAYAPFWGLSELFKKNVLHQCNGECPRTIYNRPDLGVRNAGRFTKARPDLTSRPDWPKKRSDPDYVDTQTTFSDPDTGHTITKMTNHPATDRIQYYDIPHWNMNGTKMLFVSYRESRQHWLRAISNPEYQAARLKGSFALKKLKAKKKPYSQWHVNGIAAYWLMNADGSSAHEVATPHFSDSIGRPLEQRMANGTEVVVNTSDLFWSRDLAEPNTVYFALSTRNVRTDGRFTYLVALDTSKTQGARNAQVVSVMDLIQIKAQLADQLLPNTTADLDLLSLEPPHADGKHFLLSRPLFRKILLPGQNGAMLCVQNLRSSTVFAVVDKSLSGAGSIQTFTTPFFAHRRRFTNDSALTLYVNTDFDPEAADSAEVAAAPSCTVNTVFNVPLPLSHPHVRTHRLFFLNGQSQLITISGPGSHPAWSWDGSMLSTYQGSNPVLMTLNPLGVRTLASSGTGMKGHGGFTFDNRFHVSDSAGRGPVKNSIYAADLSVPAATTNGFPTNVEVLASHNSSFGGDDDDEGSGNGDNYDSEATHPSPIASPDGTKVAFDSDAMGNPDFYVVVWHKPDAPRSVQVSVFQSRATVSWTPGTRTTEIKNYNVYCKTAAGWALRGKAFETSATIASGGCEAYAVAAQEHSGLESQLQLANMADDQFVNNNELAVQPPRFVRIPSYNKNQYFGERWARLIWTESKTTNVDHYNVYMTKVGAPVLNRENRYLVGSPKGASFLDTDLQPNTRYLYWVSAVDTQGNESVANGPVSVTTKEFKK